MRSLEASTDIPSLWVAERSRLCVVEGKSSATGCCWRRICLLIQGTSAAARTSYWCLSATKVNALFNDTNPGMYMGQNDVQIRSSDSVDISGRGLIARGHQTQHAQIPQSLLITHQGWNRGKWHSQGQLRASAGVSILIFQARGARSDEDWNSSNARWTSRLLYRYVAWCCCSVWHVCPRMITVATSLCFVKADRYAKNGNDTFRWS